MLYDNNFRYRDVSANITLNIERTNSIIRNLLINGSCN